jgi:hypothetical protein
MDIHLIKKLCPNEDPEKALSAVIDSTRILSVDEAKHTRAVIREHAKQSLINTINHELEKNVFKDSVDVCIEDIGLCSEVMKESKRPYSFRFLVNQKTFLVENEADCLCFFRILTNNKSGFYMYVIIQNVSS